MNIRLAATLAATLVLVLALAGCSRGQAYNEKIYVFGTLVDVSIHTRDEGVARRGFEVVRKELERLHKAWQPQGEGELGLLNRALAGGETASVSDELAMLIRSATDISRRTGGLFDPGVGGLVALWGFGADEPTAGPPPAPNAIEAIFARHPAIADVTVEGDRVRSANLAVQLDFGAFAKGYAVDLAIAWLRELGIESAIVNAGGDLRAIGRHGDRPWRIGIRDPRGPGVLASVEIDGDESVFTSGDYERFYDWEGRRYHHIIDPRTGYPSVGLSSATVIHTEAALADAAATALLVAGPDGWKAVARDLGLALVMVVGEDGSVRMTPQMAKRLHFEQDGHRIEVEETGT